MISARSPWTGVRARCAVVAAGAVLMALGVATPAFAGPYWHVSTNVAPTNLPPGGEGQIVASATDLGDEEAKASPAHPITITDVLPAGLKVLNFKGLGYVENETIRHSVPNLNCSSTKIAGEQESVTCEITHSVPAYEGFEVVMLVKVNAAPGTLLNEVHVEGGEGVPRASPPPEALKVDAASTPFGVERYELRPESEDGSLDTQAGSHPFQLTTTFDLNQSLSPYKPFPVAEEEASAPRLARDLHFVLPPGLLGNVTVVPQCSDVDFAILAIDATNECPGNTAVGVARLTINEPNDLGVITATVPVFNLTPVAGEPARFGVEIDRVPVILTTSVRTGSNYAVEVTTTDTTTSAELLSSQLTFWGVPGDPRHDQSRGWECLGNGHYVKPNGGERIKPCLPFGQTKPPPFLTLPTSCAERPSTSVTGDSWPRGAGKEVSALEGEHTTYQFPSTLTGCNALDFSPSISVEPETHAASTPTGMTVKVRIPQESTLSATGLAEADAKETTVALPEGLQASPGAANGLVACSAASVGFTGSQSEIGPRQNEEFSPGEASCPDPAKIGAVRIKTPLLKNELQGSVYLAEQDTNPFRSPLVLYLIAEDPETGVRVKLAGDVSINETTGQLTSTFSQTPPVPFEELTLNLFGGPRASQSTPALCGAYTTTSSFTPWSGGAAATPSAGFAITQGPNGGPCPSNPLPMTPSFHAGATNPAAGAFSPFTITIGNPDGNQALTGLAMTLPKGAAAMLASVTPCTIARADTAQCGPESLIGHATASSGLGGAPYTLHGNAYLTETLDGAPFGVSVATPAVAGPFNLGTVIANSTIQVDPNTAQASITAVESRLLDPTGNTQMLSSPLPTIVKGVPVQLKALNVTVDRPQFEFNPTNCNPSAVNATLTGSQGGSVPVSAPFQITNCAHLPFTPTLTASVAGQASKQNGTTFTVKVTSAPGQANIAKTFLQLPIALPSRLTTIQKACLAATFLANPATCPEGSNIGRAVAHTPVLKKPLEGPAYLVSHGNAGFPDVEFVLQGEGITLVLDGKTDIKKGITYSRFETVPDAPVSTFETVLPAGPHSALTANVPESQNYNLCSTKLEMPTEITGQNGALIKTTTKIAVTGCKQRLSSGQLLAKALAACRKLKKKSKRVACEARARKKYKAKGASKAKKAKRARR